MTKTTMITNNLPEQEKTISTERTQEQERLARHCKGVEKEHELEDFFFEEFINCYCSTTKGDDQNWRSILFEYLWSDDDYLETCPPDDVEETDKEEAVRIAKFLKENVFGKMNQDFIQYKIDMYRSYANFLETYKHYGYED
jgi:hypothetical protein